MIRKANWLFIIASIAALSFSSCTTKQRMVKVTVTNPTNIERNNEIVEIDLEKINKKLSLNSGQKMIVTNKSGDQLPFQLITNGNETPSSIIFAVSLKDGESSTYQIMPGTPNDFDPLVYGRLVPERKDDFTWENNRVAYRVYGPALQATGEISGGLDIWVKRTENLIINKWYKDDLAGKASYHHDHGEGLDFYKVGPTLGLGMTAPMYDDKLVLGKNFTKVEILDNGPLRISFKLFYAPYTVGETEVNETRIITLDANEYLNKVVKVFETNDKSNLKLATGFIVSGKDNHITFAENADGIIAYQVPTDKNYGTIFTGAINLMGYEDSKLANNHFLGINSYTSGKEYIYYTGGGWSKSGFDSFEDWTNYLKKERVTKANPLKIKIK